MIYLSGKSAVVTGGSRGIGCAIALRLAEQDADVETRAAIDGGRGVGGDDRATAGNPISCP